MAWNFVLKNSMNSIRKKALLDNISFSVLLSKMEQLDLTRKVQMHVFKLRTKKQFWTDVVNTACYLVNRSPSTAIDFKTPIKVWCNKPGNYSMLKVFGCLAYYHVNEGKLEPRAKKGVFVGYENRVKGFKIQSLSKRKVILSRDVTFDELTILHSKSVVDSSKKNDVTKQVDFESSTIRNFRDQQNFEASSKSNQNLQMQPQQQYLKSIEMFNQMSQNLLRQPKTNAPRKS